MSSLTNSNSSLIDQTKNTLNLDLEKFYQIDEYPDFYINRKGVVETNRTKNGRSKFDTRRVVSHYVEDNGYWTVRLTNENHKNKRHYIHVLVAKTFLHNPNNYPSVDHIDRNKNNNRFDNLCFQTLSWQQFNRRIIAFPGCITQKTDHKRSKPWEFSFPDYENIKTAGKNKNKKIAFETEEKAIRFQLDRLEKYPEWQEMRDKIYAEHALEEIQFKEI